MANIPAFPLQWPPAVPRTNPLKRKASAFRRLGWATVLSDLHSELHLLGAKHVTISTNQPVRQDGEPYAQARKIIDPGVAVYFTLEDQVCFPCDKFSTIAENLRAVTLHLETIRAQQRYGVGTARQAFAGYKALPANTGTADWWTVLGVTRDQATADLIQTVYRILIRTAANNELAMVRLNVARDQALTEIGRA